MKKNLPQIILLLAVAGITGVVLSRMALNMVPVFHVENAYSIPSKDRVQKQFSAWTKAVRGDRQRAAYAAAEALLPIPEELPPPNRDHALLFEENHLELGLLNDTFRYDDYLFWRQLLSAADRVNAISPDQETVFFDLLKKAPGDAAMLAFQRGYEVVSLERYRQEGRVESKVLALTKNEKTVFFDAAQGIPLPDQSWNGVTQNGTWKVLAALHLNYVEFKQMNVALFRCFSKLDQTVLRLPVPPLRQMREAKKRFPQADLFLYNILPPSKQ